MQEHYISRQRKILRLIPCSAMLVFSCFAWAQSLDDVHVMPRDDADKAALVDTIPVERLPTMDAHTAALRVAVDLVLVPVTVTDTMSHPVNTLKKQNFALFEGDKPQAIRYFYTEEAPIS